MNELYGNLIMSIPKLFWNVFIPISYHYVVKVSWLHRLGKAKVYPYHIKIAFVSVGVGLTFVNHMLFFTKLVSSYLNMYFPTGLVFSFSLGSELD